MRLEYIGLALLVIVMIIACGPSQEELQGQIDDRILANAEKLRGPQGEKGDQGVSGPKGLSLVVTATPTLVPTPTQTPTPIVLPTMIPLPTPIPTPASANLDKFGGVITTHVNLSIEYSPYVISSNTLITSGATVTVEPGVELRFKEAIGLVVQGKLVVNPENKETVRFVPHGDKSWAGISFGRNFEGTVLEAPSGDYKDGSLLRGCFIHNPIGPLEAQGSELNHPKDPEEPASVSVRHGSLLIDNCEIVGKASRITQPMSYNLCYGLSREELDHSSRPVQTLSGLQCDQRNGRGIGIRALGDHREGSWVSLNKVTINGFSSLVGCNSYPKLAVTDSVLMNTHNVAISSGCDETYVKDSTFQDYVYGIYARSHQLEISDNLFLEGFNDGQPLFGREYLSQPLIVEGIRHGGFVKGNVFERSGGTLRPLTEDCNVPNEKCTELINERKSDSRAVVRIHTDEGNFSITGNLFYQNKGIALNISTYKGSIEVTDNNFVAHQSADDFPVIRSSSGPVNFSGNNFPYTAGSDVFWVNKSSDIGEIQAKNNWWGILDAKILESTIVDFTDDPTLGALLFDPWLDEPNTTVLGLTNIQSKGSSRQPNPSWIADPTPTPTSVPATPTPLPGTIGYINFNESKTGSINDSSETHIWAFTGTRGNSASVRVKVASGNLDPFLGINSPGGQTVSDDNSGDGVDAFIDVLYLNCTGTYQIVVSAWPGTTGQYEIILTDAPEGSVYNVQPC